MSKILFTLPSQLCEKEDDINLQFMDGEGQIHQDSVV